ncbi:AAEL009133-PA [Aedes aegypti]|uniref:AAEL009133-PA n=2 Tax=Aedes aegypti TaxID=7159 RepID=A0A1S4FLE0_AEDAE|nr:probable cytochrome P450 6a13 [Aedes aegypti]EAT39034.1 AAEL009133-PA [Aedes aegypti]
MWLNLLVMVFALSVILVRRRYSYWKRIGVPFIQPRFPLGSIGSIGTRIHSSQLLAQFYQQLKGSHPFAGIFYFLQPVALALDLEFVKNVMVRDFQYFHDRGLYYNEKDDPLSSHLFNIEGTKWTTLRRKLVPTFSSGKLKMMCPTVVSVADRFKMCIEKSIAKEEAIEMRELLARFTTDVIGSCAFGIECNSLENPDDKFRKMGEKVFDVSPFAILAFFFLSTFKDLARKCRISITDSEVAAFFSTIVQKTITYREKNNVQRNDFMNLLMQMMKKNKEDESEENSVTLTLDEVVAQSYVFFLGGFETSRTTMSYCLYELSLNQEVQNRARKCIQSAVAKHDGLNYEALMDMPYLEQCINESLRKYPPISNALRSTTKDYAVPGTEVILKKGTDVIVPIYAIHHDPEYYPDPELFDPDRFSADQCAKRKPFTFMPFGEGPRMCVASRFGMMETKIGLAAMLMSFRFSKCEKSIVPLKISPNHLMLTPAGGLWLKVEQLESDETEMGFSKLISDERVNRLGYSM